MNLKSTILNSVKRLLCRFGWSIHRIEQDFDSRLLSKKHLRPFYRNLADEIFGFMERSDVFPFEITFDVEEEIATFYKEYITSPFRLPEGGSRFNNLLWLYVIRRALEPDLVIDSGTYTGASAWALGRDVKAGKVLSFDIDMRNLLERRAGVDYHECDWTAIGSLPSARRILCYFDDHVDQVRRVIEASERGCRYLIFDDDFPLGAFYKMAKTTVPLPKLEFLYDATLVDGEEIVWSFRGSVQRYKVDQSYFEEGRMRIEATERLPNLSLLDGIHQTPYRLVRLRG